ncbi:MAG: NAD(P)/FAD-dependent oxidoreductase [Candidatus Eisenbacteria bacterium]
MTPAQAGKRPHVVIVGGGFGGLSAALALARAPVRVTLVDRTNHHVFQPLLYQVAIAMLSPGEVAAPIRQIVASQRNTEVLMAEVTGVDLELRRVVLADGRDALDYDTLIVATGAAPSYFGHPEFERWAPSLKSIADATAVRARILAAFESAEMTDDPAERARLLTFVLVGAGPTGVEMAGAIAELRRFTLPHEFRHFDPRAARVLLLDAGSRVLATFDERLSRRVQRRLEQMGIELRLNARVERVDAEGVMVNGERIESRTVVWTAGVTPSSAAAWLGAPTDRAGRVRVAPDLSLPGHPEVLVIGDTTTFEQDGHPLPGAAQVAMQMGRFAARVAAARAAGRRPPTAFRYHDYGNMAVIGRNYAVLDSPRLKLAGFVAWVIWATIHINYLTLFSDRLLVLVQWAWTYITRQHGARLIVRPQGSAGPPAAPAT